jgi:Holliday junction resolvase
MARINSRAKGAKNERKVCKTFQEWTGFEFNRTPASGGLRWKKTDNIVGDLICSEPNIIFPFSVEVKAYEEINFEHLLYLKDTKIEKFWNQALEDSQRGQKIPLLLMRYNGMPSDLYFLGMNFKHFLRFRKHLKLEYTYAKLPKHKLVILNSKALFEAEYTPLEKIAKKIIKETWPRK